MAKTAPPPADARALAWDILVAVDGGAFADTELGRRSRAAALGPREQALATRLVYGTLAWQGHLDALIAVFGRPPERIDAPIRALLRLALFQLSRLSRVPDFAAVDTAVELSKRFRGGAASGFVNAVLRRYLRERDRFAPPPRETDAAGHLAVTLSHPRWLVEQWLAELGVGETEALLAADNEAAPTVLRVNRLRAEREAVLAQWAEAGIPARPTAFAPDGIVLETGIDPADLPGFAAGRVSVQGEASQLVGLLLDAQPGARILDACAAPGGKATYLAERMRNQGAVVAIDRNARGLAEVRRTASRLGLTCIRAVCGDAADALPAGEAPFDGILLDAPCSGLGTLRQHPEIRWRRTPAGLVEVAAEQARLLRSIAGRVRPGGLLVYATCTIARVENEEVVDAFLAEHSNFTREDPHPWLPAAAQGCAAADGYFRTVPHRGGLDGFFAARLKRRT